uniref:Papain-like cysteine peptidase n=1 Tax=viral metagenome TaxID=1070528 RepID=A0A6C0B3Z5_9ZZZZ
MEFNYLSIGNDCSSARALKDLNLRTWSGPFDWTESPFDALCACLQNNFVMFHKNVHLDDSKRNVIDDYGIKYPHDYPIKLLPGFKKSEDGFVADRLVDDNWEKYTDQAVEKYGRRIERFRNVMADKSKPIIVLYRDKYESAVIIKKILEKTYLREHIIVIVATDEKILSLNPAIIICNPEAGGKWNDKEIWNGAIQTAKQRYHFLIMKPVVVNKLFAMRFSMA